MGHLGASCTAWPCPSSGLSGLGQGCCAPTLSPGMPSHCTASSCWGQGGAGGGTPALASHCLLCCMFVQKAGSSQALLMRPISKWKKRITLVATAIKVILQSLKHDCNASSTSTVRCADQKLWQQPGVSVRGEVLAVRMEKKITESQQCVCEHTCTYVCSRISGCFKL